MCIRGCHFALPSVAYSICDCAELVRPQRLPLFPYPTLFRSPGRGTLCTTFATRDQLGFLADCSWFRERTAADGPGMPKIRLAPPSALTCGVQHGQHEEVAKHLRFSSRKCHSAQNVVCTVVRLTCAFEAAILHFHQSPTRSVTVRSWCGHSACHSFPTRRSSDLPGVVHCAQRLRRGINWASWLIVRGSGSGQLQMDRVCPKFGSHHHQRLRAACSTGSMKRWPSICVFPRESATPLRMSCVPWSG